MDEYKHTVARKNESAKCIYIAKNRDRQVVCLI